VACLALSHHQIGFWRSDEALFRHALAVTRNNDLAYYNLGVALAARGAFQEAIQEYEQALALNPVRSEAHGGLACALMRIGKLADAAREYENGAAVDAGQCRPA